MGRFDEVRARDEDRCRVCGYSEWRGPDGSWDVSPAGRLTLSHLLARGRGGTWDASNLMLMHWGCHLWMEEHPTEALLRGFRIEGYAVRGEQRTGGSADARLGHPGPVV